MKQKKKGLDSIENTGLCKVIAYINVVSNM